MLFSYETFFLSVPFENAFNLSGVEVAVVIVVDHHSGREETGSEAGDCLKCETHIFGRLVRLDAQILPYRLYDIGSALDVTGGSPAASNRMATVRDKVELLVKRSDAVNPAGRDTGTVTDGHQNGFWQVAIGLLHLLEDGHEVVRAGIGH